MSDRSMNETNNNGSRLKNIVGRMIAWLSVGAVLIGLMAFFGRYSFFAELVSSFRLQIALVLFLLGVLMIYTQFRFWSAIQFIVGIAVLFPVAWSFIPMQHAAPGPQSVSLLSYNILGDNADREPILETVQNHNADILVVIEYENSWVDAMDEATSFYSHSIKEPSNTGFGIAVFSKFPFANPTIEKSTEFDNVPAILTEVKIGGQSILLAAVHFLSPTDPARMKTRNEQMANVSRLIDEYQQGRDLPVILIGDFNCVPWSTFAADLLQDLNLRDTRQGYFYQGSWPTFNWLMRIPIDNAFVSERIHIARRDLLPVASSDHFPLYLEFSVVEKTPSATE